MSDEYNARHDAVVAREREKHHRKIAKAEAAEQNMVRTIAGLLKQDNVKRALAPDVIAASKDESRLQEIHKQARGGTHCGEDETITGIDMSRPWEN